jgi:DNA-binding transcriptional LysR family regulator
MNTNDLKIFESVAANGSFTKAAAAMFTVQSNVTARIKSLEAEFGAELFTRTSRKVALTSAGNTLMHYSKQIDHLVQEAKKEIQNSNEVSGRLKIGCIETTMAFKVPDLLARFTEAYPEVDLEFISDRRSELISNVISYKLDAAFVSAPVNMPDLEQLLIKEEQLVIIASANAPEFNEILAGQPVKIVVFDQGCVFRARLESWLNSKGIIQYKSTVLNSLEGIVNFVEAGLGISILPAELVDNYYLGRKMKSFPLTKELGTMTTVLIFRKNIPQNRALKAFIQMYE